MSKTIRLAIKRVYFEEIRSGKKTSEYRKVCPYYTRLFEVKPTHLRLHYYQATSLLVRLAGIQIIPTPTHLKHLPFLNGNQCYELKISEIVEYCEG